MHNTKLRSTQTNGKVGDDVFAIDTVLSSSAKNNYSYNETNIDMGEWGKDYKLFSYDGFAYALNEQYILYLTYPLIKDLTKEERKAVLTYRFGEEDSKDKRKPRFGDVCLYFGKVVASKLNAKGTPPFLIKDVELKDAEDEYLEGFKSIEFKSTHGKSGVIAFVPDEHVDEVLSALLLKFPLGIIHW